MHRISATECHLDIRKLAYPRRLGMATTSYDEKQATRLRLEELLCKIEPYIRHEMASRFRNITCSTTSLLVDEPVLLQSINDDPRLILRKPLVSAIDHLFEKVDKEKEVETFYRLQNEWVF